MSAVFVCVHVICLSALLHCVEHHVSLVRALHIFYNSARDDFLSQMDYLIVWCPLDDKILGHAVRIDFERKLGVTFNSVEYFVGCFPSILGDMDRDKLNEQFLQ